MAHFHPEGEWDCSSRIFNPAIYRGHDGIRRGWAEIFDAWEDYRAGPQEVLEIGDDVLLSIGPEIGHARVSGVAVSYVTAHVATFRDGLVDRFIYYGSDIEHARHAAQGLARERLT